jgi:hypothetical protein
VPPVYPYIAKPLFLHLTSNKNQSINKTLKMQTNLDLYTFLNVEHISKYEFWSRTLLKLDLTTEWKYINKLPSVSSLCVFRSCHFLEVRTVTRDYVLFGAKLGKCSVNLAFIPVFKPHTHKLYILRHCTNSVYLWSHVTTRRNNMSKLNNCTSVVFKIQNSNSKHLLPLNQQNYI